MFQTLKVFMSLALTFKFMTTDFIVFPWAFSCGIQKNLPFDVNLWQVIGPKLCFGGYKFLVGHKQRHPILAQLLVSYNGILRIEIFLWASDNFSTVYGGKFVFHLNQFYFRKWIQLWQQISQIGHKQKHLISANCQNYGIITGKCKFLDGHFIYSDIL